MQPATHIDGIRHASASRTLNVVRADTVKADSLMTYRIFRTID